MQLIWPLVTLIGPRNILCLKIQWVVMLVPSNVDFDYGELCELFACLRLFVEVVSW